MANFSWLYWFHQDFLSLLYRIFSFILRDLKNNGNGNFSIPLFLRLHVPFSQYTMYLRVRQKLNGILLVHSLRFVKAPHLILHSYSLSTNSDFSLFLSEFKWQTKVKLLIIDNFSRNSFFFVWAKNKNVMNTKAGRRIPILKPNYFYLS